MRVSPSETLFPDLHPDVWKNLPEWMSQGLTGKPEDHHQPSREDVTYFSSYFPETSAGRITWQTTASTTYLKPTGVRRLLMT